MPDLSDIDTSVDYRELSGSRKENWDGKKWKCTRVFKVVWGDRFQFVFDICGGAQKIGDQIVRKIPMKYPGLVVPTYAMNASIEGMGEEGAEVGFQDMLAYSYAKITVSYETPDFDKEEQEGETYVEESWSGSAQVITLPKGTYEFSGGEKVDESFGKLMGSSELSLTVHELPELDMAKLESMAGKINSSAFYGRAAKTVLFSTFDASRSYTSDGVTAWELGLRFIARSKPWDQLINPANGNWEEITPSPYETADLNTLLPS